MIPYLYVGPGARGATLAQAAVDLKGAPDGHPDARLEIAETGDVGIDRIRDLILWARYGPVRSARKVVVIGPAERLTREAANALLKLLEEIPPHLQAILFAEALDRVLPTVRSRCALRWCSGALAQVQAALRDAGYSEDEVAFTSSLLEERIDEATFFLSERRDPFQEWEKANREASGIDLEELAARFVSNTGDPIRRRAFGRHLAAGLRQSNTGQILKATEGVAQGGKNAVSSLLEELALFLAREAPAAWPDLPPHVLVAWGRKASLARGEIEDNANPRLLLEVVALWPRKS